MIMARSICTIPSTRCANCCIAAGKRQWTRCGNSNTPIWCPSRNRDAESLTGFTQNTMWRFPTPTSRNRAAVRRTSEKRGLQVQLSALLKYGNRTIDKKKKIDIPSYIRFIPFLSELFCAGFSAENPGWEGMGKELYEKNRTLETHLRPY